MFISVYKSISVFISVFISMSRYKQISKVYICWKIWTWYERVFMYISVNIVNICLYLSISVHMYVSVHMFVFVNINQYLSISVHISISVNMLVSVYISLYLFICVYLFIWLYLWISSTGSQFNPGSTQDQPICVHICACVVNIYSYPCIWWLKKF